MHFSVELHIKKALMSAEYALPILTKFDPRSSWAFCIL